MQAYNWAVESKAVSIRVACAIFAISTTFYRYVRKLDVENAKIADSLIQLTETNRNWGFWLLLFASAKCKEKALES